MADPSNAVGICFPPDSPTRGVVHGGAGSPSAEPADRQRTLADAIADAETAATPLEAVCRAVRPLERNPNFNAGVGGAVQGVETEAELLTDETQGRYEDAEPPALASDDHLEWVRDHFGGTDPSVRWRPTGRGHLDGRPRR